MQSALSELQEKLDSEIESVNIMRSQKEEMSTRMDQLIKDKKQAIEDLRAAEYSTKSAKDAKEVAERKLSENINQSTDRMREFMAEREQLNKTIN